MGELGLGSDRLLSFFFLSDPVAMDLRTSHVSELTDDNSSSFQGKGKRGAYCARKLQGPGGAKMSRRLGSLTWEWKSS